MTTKESARPLPDLLTVTAIALVAYAASKPHAAYFLWLFTTLNFLMGAGYFLFSGVGNLGDWADVASDTVSPLIWRPTMAVFGGVVYFLLARQSARGCVRLSAATSFR